MTPRFNLTFFVRRPIMKSAPAHLQILALVACFVVQFGAPVGCEDAGCQARRSDDERQ
jgi:hypothetical protein